MAGELSWSRCSSASSMCSSSLGSSWSSLDHYLDHEWIMDSKPRGPHNGLHFQRETIMAKVLGRLTDAPAPSSGIHSGKLHPLEQHPSNRHHLPPIVGSAASYGTSSAYTTEEPPNKGYKKTRIPVPKKQTTMSGANTTKLPPLQMGNLVSQTHDTISHPVVEEKPMKREKVKRLSRPKMAVAEALELLGNNDWEKKIAGLQIVRSLSVHHQDVAAQRLKDLHAAVITEVKNLRSAVSRAAMVCLGDMFEGLQDKMLYGLNISVRILLQKSGESNIFLRDAAEEALSCMALNIHPGRALASLIDGGISHLNPAVRSCAAKKLYAIVLRSGADYILCGGRGITDRAIPAIARCAQDGCPDARMYSRKIFQFLVQHPKLMPVVRKHITPQNLPAIEKLIRNIS